MPSHPDTPDDVVIVSALRTPITRARKGGLKDVLPEEMLGEVLKVRKVSGL